MKTHTYERPRRSRTATAARGTEGFSPGPGPPSRPAPQVRQILQAPRPQAQLTVGAPDDAFEREADEVADRVMRMPEPGAAVASEASAPPRVQRTCAHCQKELEGAGTVQRMCDDCQSELDGGDTVRRVCDDCAEEMRAKEEAGRTPEVPGSFAGRFAALRGAGRALCASEQAFFEPRFGRDFAAVRLHTGAAAAELARSVHARAFTLGRSIVFGSGQYAPGTSTGRRLLAHELTHVVQQERAAAPRSARRLVDPAAVPSECGRRTTDSPSPFKAAGPRGRVRRLPGPAATSTPPRVHRQEGLAATLRRQVPAGEQEACSGYGRREVDVSRSEAGHLDPDVELHAPGELLVADFGVDWRHVKAGTRRDPLLQRWMATWEHDASFRLEIIGYSDCVGAERANTTLRHARALRVEELLPAAVRSRVTFRGMGALGSYVTDNRSVAARARNRGVVIRMQQQFDFEPEPVPGRRCSSPPNPAADASDFVFLVQCAEGALGHTPRQMLSLLRQLYYGNQPWSLTRSRFWADVIPCGLALPDPRPRLGTLYGALRASKVVDNVDMGHVLTGLESMVCPTPTVELEVPGPNPVVAMPNEEFATWGGDLGSAAAHKTHDEVDRGLTRPWSHYFGTAGSLASFEDLQGDIDAYVVRRSLGGTPCTATARTSLPSLSSPVSRILLDYYVAAPSRGATTRADRFRCFVEAIGGTIAGGRITNKAALVRPIRNRVNSFARTYYLKLVTIPVFAIGPSEAIHLLRFSWEATERFLDWLESRL